MIIPLILLTTVITNDALLQKARAFDNTGVLVAHESYSYVKISDEYIHALYNLLDNKTDWQKPDYFSEQCLSGAHITFAYPEENIILSPRM